MIQRRFLGKQVPGAIRSCAPGDFGAVHLAFAGVRQRPIHVAGNRQRVGRLPGLWLVAKQRKLERQVADALLDKLVHAAGVRFEDFARFWVEPRRFLVRGAAERHAPAVAVDRNLAFETRKRNVSGELRQRPVDEPPRSRAGKNDKEPKNPGKDSGDSLQWHSWVK